MNKEEQNFEEQQERFCKFTKELEKLSLKYGVSLNVCGGVNVYSKNILPDLISIEYDCDSSSGDLSSTVNWN